MDRMPGRGRRARPRGGRWEPLVDFHRLLDSLGFIDEITNLLGQALVTLARLMCGDLQGDGTEEIVISLGMAPEQCLELFRSCHRPPHALFPEGIFYPFYPIFLIAAEFLGDGFLDICSLYSCRDESPSRKPILWCRKGS